MRRAPDQLTRSPPPITRPATPGSADRRTHLVLPVSLASVIAAIPVWEQYRSFMEWALDSLATLTGNAGLAIIVFTIIIKTLLLPLTIKSTRSSKAMQELSPKIKDIQKKYGKDRARASQETMALYQQYGVNPMAGCLPMLIQVPIFWGLYRAIYNLSRAADAAAGGPWAHGFLWIGDLAHPDPWKVLPILAGIFQLVQTRMMRPANMPKSDDPQQQVMNVMMNFMPLMVVLFGWNFAAGPVIYWVTQSLYSVVQQWFITGWGSLGAWLPWLPELPEHRRLGYQPPRNLDDVVVVGGAVAPRSGIGGWLQRKMEEAQHQATTRQQEAQQKRGATATEADTAEPDAATEANGVGSKADPFAAKRRDASTSYRDRVDAAASFKPKSDRTTGSTTATTAPTARKKKRKR
jgi:YidC/Oxa1 family membrane protein insertase